MIVYGTFTETSVAKLFMAGVVPGILLTEMVMLYIGVRSKVGSSIAATERGPASITECIAALVDVIPFVVLIGITMGAIYLGLVTPTEAAAIGCIMAIVVSTLWGDFSWRVFLAAMRQTISVCGNILFIIYAAFVFSYAISFAGVGEQVTSYVVGLHLSRPEFFGALFVLYTILGCLIESLGMIVITVPLLYPVLVQYGIDPIWAGVILVVFIELGQISPPIGINLFVIQSTWSGKLSDVVKGTIPFHLIMFALLVLLVLLPELALWLPSHMTVHP
jgi:tripartite ATP-independent transporter DctM subunit